MADVPNDKLSKLRMPSPDEALPGREQPIAHSGVHYVNGNSTDQLPQGYEEAIFGLGCFWGAERRFWQSEGVYATAVGYAQGSTPNPTYQEVCSGMTGHNEVVRIWFNPEVTSFGELLEVFWESHDPTQGMRQGNDIGTQYRSGIYVMTEAQEEAALQSREHYGKRLASAGYGEITTEILRAGEFFYAEEYHQQYLAKVPNSYCGLGGLGVP